MLTDRFGLTLSTTSSRARDAYVEGCDLVLAGQPGAETCFDGALSEDANFALAWAGKARAHQLRSEMPLARDAMGQTVGKVDRVTAREMSHVAFHSLLISGQAAAAVTAAKAHLNDWPRDAMILQPCTSAFGLIGMSGRPGREVELASWLDGLAPHYGDDWWFIGQHAFALIETGQRDAGRPKIQRATMLNPRNASAAHILSHMYYEDGERDAAHTYLTNWISGYSPQGVFHGHLNWHLALCELEAGNERAAFKVYTDALAPGAHTGAAVFVIADAVSFLWRAELAGHPRDLERWKALHAFAHKMFPNPSMAYTDTHVALIDAVNADGSALEARIRKLEDMERQGKLAAGAIGPKLSQAFAAFLRQNYDAAIAAIEPIFADHERLGGSRAQRDIVEFTLLKAYINAGRMDEARRMLLARRPGPRGVPIAGVPTEH
jgi:tetratricopeptide (TPR) repeat protein